MEINRNEASQERKIKETNRKPMGNLGNDLKKIKKIKKIKELGPSFFKYPKPPRKENERKSIEMRLPGRENERNPIENQGNDFKKIKQIKRIKELGPSFLNTQSPPERKMKGKQ